MLDSDKKEFASIVSATLKTYRIEPDADVLRLWWGVLKRFSIDQVRNGFNAYIGSKDAKFIVPANIVEAIEKNEPDGRLGAEEAWAIYPHDEATSAVITNEMAEAMQSAQELLSYGDRIGARMAFKEAYNRIVERNKLNGVLPRWFASLGHSKEGRELALKDAVIKGRISQDHATSLLPSPIPNSVVNAIAEVKFLTAKDVEFTDDEREKARKKMAEIKAMLQSGNA
jgi:hypothetical protein